MKQNWNIVLFGAVSSVAFLQVGSEPVRYILKRTDEIQFRYNTHLFGWNNRFCQTLHFSIPGDQMVQLRVLSIPSVCIHSFTLTIDLLFVMAMYCVCSKNSDGITIILTLSAEIVA